MTEQVTCAECGESIKPHATLCSHCQSYQSPFWRKAVLVTRALALLGVVGSAIAYLVSAWPDVRKKIAWQDDVTLMRVSLIDGVDGINLGDGPIYVRQVEFEPAPVPGGARARHVIEWVREEAGTNAHFSRQFAREGGGVIDDATPEEWVKLVKSARAPSDKAACVVIQIVANDEPDLAMYKSVLGAKMMAFDVSGTVNYFSIDQNRTRKKKFPATGFLLRRSGCVSGQESRAVAASFPAAQNTAAKGDAPPPTPSANNLPNR